MHFPFGCYRAAIFAGLVALLGGMAAANANDRGIRGTMISPSSCTVNESASRGNCVLPPEASIGYFTGNGWIGKACQFVLGCPVPFNNIDLGGSSSDNDVSSFRVHYRTGAALNQVIVRLIRSQVTAGAFVSSSVCGGVLTPATTAPTKTIVSCPHDVAENGVFYHFEVVLNTGFGSGAEPWFLGIDFPQ